MDPTLRMDADDPPCPRCRTLLRLDPLHAEEHVAGCENCQMVLLLKKPPPPTQPPWPPGWVVVEMWRPDHDSKLEPCAADPYRSPVTRTQLPGLSIEWKRWVPEREDSNPRIAAKIAGSMAILLLAALLGTQVRNSYVATALLVAGVVAMMAILDGREQLFPREPQFLVFGVRADREGLHWDDATRHLPTSDVDQLYVQRRELVDADHAIVYALMVRDRSGRDHEIAVLVKQDQARWLEDRLERHLQIEDRAVDNKPR